MTKKKQIEVLFNESLAEQIVSAVSEGIRRAKEIDLGPTRRRGKLPKIVKQTGRWEVDPAQLEGLETVMHLIACAIFGVDQDGDCALKWRIVDRSRFATFLPYMDIPHAHKIGNDERAMLEAVESAATNMNGAHDQLSTYMRLYKDAVRRRQDNEPFVYNQITDAATDSELPFIEDAAERAGLIWKCRAEAPSSSPCRYINWRDEAKCGNCGAPKPEKED